MTFRIFLTNTGTRQGRSFRAAHAGISANGSEVWRKGFCTLISSQIFDVNVFAEFREQGLPAGTHWVNWQGQFLRKEVIAYGAVDVAAQVVAGVIVALFVYVMKRR